MTKHDDMDYAGQRQAGTEIEVTNEMVESAIRELGEYWDPGPSILRGVAVSVLNAALTGKDNCRDTLSCHRAAFGNLHRD